MDSTSFLGRSFSGHRCCRLQVPKAFPDLSGRNLHRNRRSERCCPSHTAAGRRMPWDRGSVRPQSCRLAPCWPAQKHGNSLITLRKTHSQELLLWTEPISIHTEENSWWDRSKHNNGTQFSSHTNCNKLVFVQVYWRNGSGKTKICCSGVPNV